jgi:hypothetical protein
MADPPASERSETSGRETGDRDAAAADVEEDRRSGGPRGLVGDVSVTEILSLVGLFLLLNAWQLVVSNLAYPEVEPGQAFDVENKAWILVGGAVPGLVVAVLGYLALRSSERVSRNGAALLLLGAPLIIGTGATVGDVALGEGGYRWQTPVGLGLWLTLATGALLRRRSILTVGGFAAAFVLFAALAGQQFIDLVFRIDPDNEYDAVAELGPSLALARAAWLAAFALASFAMARRTRPVASDPSNQARLVLDLATAGLMSVGLIGLIVGWSSNDSLFLPRPWNSVVLGGAAALAAAAGWLARSAPYYAAGGLLLFAAVFDLVILGAGGSSVAPELALAGLLILGLDLAIVLVRRRRAAPDASARPAGVIGVPEVLAALGSVLLLVAWHLQIDLGDEGATAGRGVVASLPPAVLLGLVGLVLLPYRGARARVAGVALLVAGGELTRGVAALFAAITGNESGVGPAIGAAYWLGLAAVAKWRAGTFVTQLGWSASLAAVGLLGGQALLSSLFETAQYDYDPFSDTSTLASPDPGIARLAVLGAWVAGLSIAAFWVARRERRAGGRTSSAGQRLSSASSPWGSSRSSGQPWRSGRD